MSGNTSATGGYLTPTSPPPAEDLDLDLVFQGLVAGLTGLPGSLVRPRWQRNDAAPHVPPTQPPAGTDWASVGVTEQDPHDYPVEQHFPEGDGRDEQARYEKVEVLASFYGPNAGRNMRLVRDGVYVAQNRDVLATFNIKLTQAGTPRRVPDLTNEQWVGKWDLPLTFERGILTVYPILNILQSPGVLNADTGNANSFNVPQE